jgi:23S rRNA-intervening sequence protein
VWQKSYRLTLAIYRATELFPKAELFGLTSQIRRASVSIEANLAEGCGRRSRRDGAIRPNRDGVGCGVVLSLLLARDLGMISKTDYSLLAEGTTEILRMLSPLSEKVKRPAVRRSQLRADS